MTMRLQDFVNNTLTQIIQGVRDAQESHDPARHFGYISPPIQTDLTAWERLGILRSGGQMVQQVEFDVAVEASTEGGGSGQINVFGFGGIEGGGSAASSTVSRIKFRVPIILPEQGDRAQ